MLDNELILESGYRFHRFHEELNRVIKVNVISLSLMRTQLDTGITEDAVKQQVYATGELWGGMPSWKNPYDLLDSARFDLGNNGVVRVFSAFDLFMDSLEGELESWNSFGDKSRKKSIQRAIKKANQADDDEDVGKFFRLLNRKGWHLDNEKEISAIYSYYRLARNCIAHRDGIVSAALEEVSHDPQLDGTVNEWQKMTGNKTAPPITKMTFGESIRFTHRDAIFASSVTRSIALNTNNLAVHELGEDGVVYLFAQKYILKENIAPKYLQVENVSKAIAFMMNTLSRYMGATQEGVKEILQRLGIFDECKKTFKRLKAAYFL